MGLSSEVRKLENKWSTRGGGNGWPKFLEWIEITGLRGWEGERIEFPFPIMAIVGENGSGKSTVLQCAASVYKETRRSSEGRIRFASDFFPDTVWDRLTNITIRFSYREGGKSYSDKSIRKPTDRWRGNPSRPERNVEYIDLSRTQPVSARTGYKRLANPSLSEKEATSFDQNVLDRFCNIMGRKYESARMALTNLDSKRRVPVVGQKGNISYSGFHQGASSVKNFL